MIFIAEQIVKNLQRRGIRPSVHIGGALALRGRTRELTEADRIELNRHKPEIVHYLTEQPISPVAMYVAPDLDYWITDAPPIWADKITVNGKSFVRLTSASIVWFRERIDKAEAAYVGGKLTLDVFARIVDDFCPIYEFALRAGLVAPSPALTRALGVQGASKGTSGGLEV